MVKAKEQALILAQKMWDNRENKMMSHVNAVLLHYIVKVLKKHETCYELLTNMRPSSIYNFTCHQISIFEKESKGQMSV